MNKDVIVALDFSSLKEVESFLKPFKEENLSIYVKVGMELYYKEGDRIIKFLKREGYKIFLDLKLFDIPNTVKSALSILKKYDIDIVNVHALGGTQMLKVAQEVFKDTDTLVIGVTILTSMNQENLNEISIKNNIDDLIIDLATNVKNCGLSGVVCSVFEAAKIKDTLGDDFITITPGIRVDSNSNDDQKRVATPKVAHESKTDFIVVGRSITASKNPVEEYKNIKKDFIGDNNEF